MKMPRSKTKHSTASHRHAEKQERRVAVEVGGKKTYKSGAGVVKGDVLTPDSLSIMLDCKVTKHDSYSLKISDWRMLKTQAIQQNRFPGLQIEFIDEESETIREQAVVLPYNYFLYLCERLQELEKLVDE